MSARRTSLAFAVLAVAAVGCTPAPPEAGPAGLSVAAGPDVTCAPGELPEPDVSLATFARGETGTCIPALHPEPPHEVMAAQAHSTARRGGGYPVADGALEAAHQQHVALARSSSPAVRAPRWEPLGRGPLNSDVPGYIYTNGSGLHQVAGRIQDLARDPARPGRWIAAVANGGVWETTNAGEQWRSIGDPLPTQVVGAVSYLPNKFGAPRGVLLAGTGDPAFGGSSIPGMGVFRSLDGGRTWRKAQGVPAGTLTFSFSHDPARPVVVYAATSKGLFRSADAGANFRNVGLPTGCTNLRSSTCFFANIVTDVVVRPSDEGGKGGGAVLAAVGWRAGTAPNHEGKPQAPQNGLYTSSSGGPGSFTYLPDAPGFAPANVVGRTALAVATGASQDHDYVYAVVQDAVKFNGGALTLDQPDAARGVAKTPYNTVLDGIYGSGDFGRTWTKMADAAQLQLPGTGTALTGLQTPTFAPGVQSWYNAWIAPDPTRQDSNGVPTRLAFGLEEVWTGSGELPVVPGGSRFTVVGRYFAGTSCGGLNAPVAQGHCPNQTDPTKRQGSTTHPDQHAALWVPDGRGGVTLVVGNDGGAYKQVVAAGAELTSDGWGKGLQNGFRTLMPYDVAMSGDGTVVMGLQDNGAAVITPEGQQIMAFGGDGFFTAIHPEDSQTWYEEYVGGAISVTTNGGKTWRAITPPDMTGALFGTPLVMDPTDPEHLITGGRKVWETTHGATTTTRPAEQLPAGGRDWRKVFDLGTRTRPGDAAALPSADDPVNAVSAADTRGDASYVAYCGSCDVVTDAPVFGSGIATNVGSDKDPRAGSSDGWHVAAARGLPQRYVTSIRIDPRDRRTVYATLGGYGRRWIPPGALGDDTSRVGDGHVFVSRDAGETFADISRNLPDVSANDALPIAGGLAVATDLGVYWAGSARTGRFSVLGSGLPTAPVFRLNRSPRDPRELLAASFGRGPYRIVVAGGPRADVDRETPPPPVTRGESAARAETGASGAAPGPSGHSNAPPPGSSAVLGRQLTSSWLMALVLLSCGVVLAVARGLRRRGGSR